MSIDLLTEPDTPHTILDDMESFFWVLMFMAIHYLPSGFRADSLQMFDECIHHPEHGHVGGSQKIAFLFRSLKAQSFPCVPLNSLVGDLWMFFREYKDLREMRKPEFSERHSRLIEDPSEILAFFDTALQSKEWPANDKVPDRFPPATPTAAATRGVVEKETNTRLVATSALPTPGPSTSRAPPPSTSASHGKVVQPTSPVQASASSSSSLKRPTTEREVDAEQPKPSKRPKKSKSREPPVPVRRSSRIRNSSSGGVLSSSARSGASKRTSRR